MFEKMEEKMTFELPTLDPLWVSVGVTIVLVGITIFYALQTWRMANISQKRLLYQRKPQFTILIEKETFNNIRLTFRNTTSSISSVKNINADLILLMNDEKIIFGKYFIEGPLFPGDEDTQDITDSLRTVLINRKLMTTHRIEWPKQDNFGYYSSEYEDIYTILKGKIEFDIYIKACSESDIEFLKEDKFNIERVFNILLRMPYTPHDEPPPDYYYEDNYETIIKMKSGDWIRSPDYIINSSKIKDKKKNNVGGLS